MKKLLSNIWYFVECQFWALVRLWRYHLCPHAIRRKIRFFWQRRTKGYSDDETWDLDVRIARFVLPRLLRLKELQNGYPFDLTEESWDEILDKMIFSFELVIRCHGLDEPPGEAWLGGLNEKYQEGMDLFAKHFMSLGW